MFRNTHRPNLHETEETLRDERRIETPKLLKHLDTDAATLRAPTQLYSTYMVLLGSYIYATECRVR